MMTGGTLIPLAVLGLGAYLLIRALQQPASPPTAGPEQILGERFARGEIDEQEYQQRPSTLRAQR